MYSTGNGIFGLISCNNTVAQKLWHFQTESQTNINCFTLTNFLHSGENEITVGREDGTIEIFSLSDATSSVGRLLYRFEYCKLE